MFGSNTLIHCQGLSSGLLFVILCIGDIELKNFSLISVGNILLLLLISCSLFLPGCSSNTVPPTATLIAISATGPDLDAEADPYFGTAAWFIIVDREKMSYETVENTNAAEVGAGRLAAQQLIDLGVDAVITGSVGGGVMYVLSPAGVAVVSGASGTVREVILKYLELTF
jgi:predicted Fe-Mo cluster-binding NifX family protein